MGKHSKTKEKKSRKSRRAEKRKKRRFGRKLFLFILLICMFTGVWFAKRVNDLDGNWMAALLGHNKSTLENLETFRILILGESTGLSDTIIVASYNPKTQKASMLSIPRDTYVSNGNYKNSPQNKINCLFNGGETPQKTLDAVNELTGLNIQNYILVDTEALIKLVDLIGGLNFEVPTDMKYDDSSQNLHINLKAGYQKLTGEQVEQVVRFRHNNDGSSYSYEYGNEDYGRMRTQRSVIMEIAKQTFKLKNIKEIKNIIGIMEEDVKTNIDFDYIKDYIPYAAKLDIDSIQTEQLPGKSEQRNGGWFFFNDKQETAKVVDRLFNQIEIVDEIETSEEQ